MCGIWKDEKVATKERSKGRPLCAVYKKKCTDKIRKFYVAGTGYVGWVSIVDTRKLSLEFRLL